MTAKQDAIYKKHLDDRDRAHWQKRALKCPGRLLENWSESINDSTHRATDVKCGFNHRVNYEYVNDIKYKPCLYETCPFIHWAEFIFAVGFTRPLDKRFRNE